MKVNKSIVLTFLTGVVVSIYFLSKIYQPSSPLYISTDTEYDEISLRYDIMSYNLKMLNNYEKTEIELLTEIDKLNILQCIYQEEIINILYDILKTCNVKLSKISFSEVHSVNINGRSSNVIENTKTSDNPIEALSMTVSIEFYSSYDNLLLFIDEIQDSRWDISISNIRLINHEGGEMQCAMKLSFYSLEL